MIANFQGKKKNLKHYKQTHLKETYWSVLGGKCFHMHGAADSISKTDNHIKTLSVKLVKYPGVTLVIFVYSDWGKPPYIILRVPIKC